MKIITIITVSNTDHPGFVKLKESLDRNKYDYMVITDPNLNWNWSGLGSIHEWCKTQQEFTHFLYTDGFDTLAMGGIEEVYERYKCVDKMLFSAEKACFPRSDWANLHTSESRWRYLNHGQFITPISLYLKLYEGVFDLPFTCQEWAMEKFLNGGDIELDTKCDIFQSIAFKGEDEYSSDGNRLVNNITGTKATFAHGNGRSDMEWVYEISESIYTG